jgi:hypothetical protein
MKNRTGIDFKEHDLQIIKTPTYSIYDLKSPKSDFIYRVKFINIDGVLLVKGDFGNWIFCREFHPSKECVSDYYWTEKLQTHSIQDPFCFDSTATRKLIEEKLNGGLEEYGYEGHQLEEMKEYMKESLNYVDLSEGEYISFAYYNAPSFLDAESVPFRKRIDTQLLAVFDAFDEIYNRMKKEQEIYKVN